MNDIGIVSMSAVGSWKQVSARLEKTVSGYSEADLQREVAPGRNRIYYLVGHLAAVHDRMLPLLLIGERRYSELDEAFLTKADRVVADSISGEELREALRVANLEVTAGLEGWSAEEFLKRHSAVSEEDFAVDPLRNRLSVLLSRTNHASFHLGQMLLVK